MLQVGHRKLSKLNWVMGLESGSPKSVAVQLGVHMNQHCRVHSHFHACNEIISNSISNRLIPLVSVPTLLPAWKERRFWQCLNLPIPRNHSLLDLFLLILFQRWDHSMLCVPCVLVLHNTPFSFSQDLQNNGWNVWLLPEILDRRKQCLEVEAYRARKW